jgi:hypothetical protein
MADVSERHFTPETDMTAVSLDIWALLFTFLHLCISPGGFWLAWLGAIGVARLCLFFFSTFYEHMPLAQHGSWLFVFSVLTTSLDDTSMFGWTHCAHFPRLTATL